VIVGIGHNFRVGKDTAADGLVRDAGFRRRAFADPLKELALIADPIVVPTTSTVNVNVGHGRLKWFIAGTGWDEAKATFPEVRRFLQELGLGAREVFGENFWIEQCLMRISADDDVVIPDVRYRNEADAISEAGGVLIKIVRAGHHGDGHASERDLDEYEGWDAIINNDGSIQDLQNEVLKVVSEKKKKKNDRR
jgi:hypothetical protein